MKSLILLKDTNLNYIDTSQTWICNTQMKAYKINWACNSNKNINVVLYQFFNQSHLIFKNKK